MIAAERAFAKAMADRDPQAFASYLADEAIFLSGSSRLQGKKAVIDGWAVYFTAPTAPFSWEPEEVEVFASGRLAASSGPVRNPQGKVIARFNSIWQRDESGRWRVVFDKGSRVGGCECP